MTVRVELTFHDGSRVPLDVAAPGESDSSRGDVVDASRLVEEVSKSAHIAFREVTDVVRAVAIGAYDRLTDLAGHCEEVVIEFGITVDAKAGVLLASTRAEASFSVAIKLALRQS